jgi:hypothetical protein
MAETAALEGLVVQADLEVLVVLEEQADLVVQVDLVDQVDQAAAAVVVAAERILTVKEIQATRDAVAVAVLVLLVVLLAHSMAWGMQQLLERQIQAVVVVAQGTTEMARVVALVSLFFLFQPQITQAQPQAHQQLLHQAQIQF